MTQRPRLRRIIGTAGGVAAGASVANALGYVLTVIAARVLGPAEFGAFSALLALIIVGNVAALAIQATVARDIVRGRPTGGTVVGGLILAALVGGVLVVATPVVSAFLSLPSAAAAVAAVGGLVVPEYLQTESSERFSFDGGERAGRNPAAQARAGTH